MVQAPANAENTTHSIRSEQLATKRSEGISKSSAAVSVEECRILPENVVLSSEKSNGVQHGELKM